MSPRYRVDHSKSKLHERRRRRRNLLIVLAISSVVLVLAGALGATWLPLLRVTSVKVAGAQTVPEGEVVSLAQNQLAGAYGFVVPKNDLLFYPKGAIERSLFSRFPALSSVSVHMSGLHTLSIGLTERQPHALWCPPSADALKEAASSTPEGATSAPCFLMDKDGVVYAPAPAYSGDPYRRYFATGSSTLPWQFLSPSQFHSLSALLDALESGQGASIESVMIDPNEDVYAKFSNGFTLIFALNDDSADVVRRFSLALKATPFQSHQLADFDYLDLRYGNKLFYKLKDAASAATAR